LGVWREGGGCESGYQKGEKRLTVEAQTNRRFPKKAKAAGRAVGWKLENFWGGARNFLAPRKLLAGAEVPLEVPRRATHLSPLSPSCDRVAPFLSRPRSTILLLLQHQINPARIIRLENALAFLALKSRFQVSITTENFAAMPAPHVLHSLLIGRVSHLCAAECLVRVRMLLSM
jgi:hypothetical protein